jgi:hypothetical protein
MDTPERHKLNLHVDPDDTCKWLRAHGYDVTGAGNPFFGDEPGLLFARPNEPVRLVLNHRILVWKAGEVRVLQDRHVLRAAGDPRGTEAWLRQAGYTIGPMTDGHDFWFQRDRWPTLTARLGDTLVWDGHTLTVEEP